MKYEMMPCMSCGKSIRYKKDNFHCKSCLRNMKEGENREDEGVIGLIIAGACLVFGMLMLLTMGVWR